ncbi:sterol desaturase family protein [Sphingoaurantiacus capsulatus]|uniref:Sterol desaturase family protein n=1 Tax=Sphingoaurantiacus capsulatus TaxID=1771310 RepID=A0ABV7XCY9_9SPHN
MSLGTGLLILIVTIAAMEVFAYAMHRWVMHGFLWVLHESHHRPRDGWFEANDWFAVIFALPSVALIFMGTQGGFPPAVAWVGAGIAAYGMIYFGFHDIIVHRRLKHGWRPKGAYMRRIVQAHRLHHAAETKHGTVSFGFLYAPPVRRLKAELAANEQVRLRASSTARRAR